MSLRSCVFVARTEGEESTAAVRARVAALARFYVPMGLQEVAYMETGLPGVVAGRIGAGPSPDGILLWGAPFGAGEIGHRDALADDAELREALIGFGAAVVREERGLRIITAPAGPLSMYVAEGRGVVAWATHAVAAGYLAHGSVSIDRDAMPELVAFDFVGSTRSPIASVQRVPPASRIDVAQDGHFARTYWPSEGRWAPVSEDTADEHTAEALLDSLDRRAGRSRHVALALTAGADSRVLAVALAQLGVETSAFTWGAGGWPEVEGARGVATHLRLPFTNSAEWRADGDIRRIIDRDARWTDGTLILSASERIWPEGADAVLLGAAGEVGRAFYYHRAADHVSPDDASTLIDVMRAERRLGNASDEARHLLRATVNDWLEQARASGRSGWDVLDVLYAEQRVGCWGRSQMPALACDVLAGFASQEVLRGLASLPLADRLSDGFHRRFVADRHPEIALPVPSSEPAGLSAPRRAIRRVRRRLGPRPQISSSPILKSAWDERPAAQSWVADGVLGSPLIRETLGDTWADRVRAAFLAGNQRGVAQAAVACGPVALAEAISELARDDH